MKISNLNGVADGSDDSVIMLSYTTDGGTTYESKKIRLADLIDDFQMGDLADVSSVAPDDHGFVLTWDGSQWTSAEATVLISVKNSSGGTILKGAPVYVAGTHASGKPLVAPADANGADTYPAVGLLHEDLLDEEEGHVLVSGMLHDMDTSGYSAGDALYVSETAGQLTSTRPTATATKVQKVGLVTRSHAGDGHILVIGPGRTNDINNELVTLIGLGDRNASNLGTFTGTTISDSASIKTALQELETSLEAVPGASGYPQRTRLASYDSVNSEHLLTLSGSATQYLHLWGSLRCSSTYRAVPLVYLDGVLHNLGVSSSSNRYAQSQTQYETAGTRAAGNSYFTTHQAGFVYKNVTNYGVEANVPLFVDLKATYWSGYWVFSVYSTYRSSNSTPMIMNASFEVQSSSAITSIGVGTRIWNSDTAATGPRSLNVEYL